RLASRRIAPRLPTRWCGVRGSPPRSRLRPGGLLDRRNSIVPGVLMRIIAEARRNMIRVCGKHSSRTRLERSRLTTRRVSILMDRPPTGALPSNPRTLVVIPTYNECESISVLLREVRRLVDVDILVVDDSSPDGTADAVAHVQANDPAI